MDPPPIVRLEAMVANVVADEPLGEEMLSEIMAASRGTIRYRSRTCAALLDLVIFLAGELRAASVQPQE